MGSPGNAPLNSIILGAFLHDIGKPYSRRLLRGGVGSDFFHKSDEIRGLMTFLKYRTDIKAYRHIVYGLAFLREMAYQPHGNNDDIVRKLTNASLLETVEEERTLWSSVGFDIDLVKAVILLHHTPVEKRDRLLEGLGEEFEFSPEAYKEYYDVVDIIRVADHSTARVQRSKQSFKGTGQRYLLNILRLIDHDVGSLGGINITDAFNVPTTSLTSWKNLNSILFGSEQGVNQQVLTELLEGVVGILHNVHKGETKEEQVATKFLSLLDILLKRTLYYTPSSYLESAPVVSLYEHLYSTATIAAVLSMLGNVPDSKLHVAVLDFSGVQRYIYDLWSNKYGTKILRARSILVNLILEAIKLKFFEEFKLPFVVELLNTGGKVSFLVPDITGDIEDRFETFTREVEEELFRLYGGRLSINFALSEGIRNDKKETLTVRVVDNLAQVIQDAMFRLKVSKRYPFKSRMLDPVDNKTFKGTESVYIVQNNTWHRAGSAELCKLCGRSPATEERKMGDDEESIKICSMCNALVDFGKKIAELGLDGKKKGNRWLPFIGFVHPDTGGHFEDGLDFIPFYRLRFFQSGREVAGVNYLYSIKYTIPTFSREQDKSILNVLKQAEQVFYFPIATYVPRNTHGRVKSFKELAAGLQKDSSDYLAVLKLDMDSLGQLFGVDVRNLYRALQGQGDDHSNEQSGHYALSFMRTASHWIRLFFEVYIPALISSKEGQNFNDLYIVYAGGDDLVLLGKWNNVVMFVAKLEEKWREYLRQDKQTGGNLHFSAAITLFKESSPVLKAIEYTDDKLLEAKSYKGKNRVYFLVETVKKEDFLSIVGEVENKFFRKEQVGDFSDTKGGRSTTLLYRVYKLLDKLSLDLSSKNTSQSKQNLMSVLVYIMYTKIRREKQLPKTKKDKDWVIRYLSNLYDELRSILKGFNRNYGKNELGASINKHKAQLGYLLYRFRQSNSEKS